MEAKILSRQIEGAQKKVEEQNFVMRKNVLKYDDVMNRHRGRIYEQRRQVLDGEDMSDQVRSWIDEIVEETVLQFTQEQYPEDWDIEALVNAMDSLYTQPKDEPITAQELREDLSDITRESLIEDFQEEARDVYAAKEEEFSADLMRELERFVILQVVDVRWREHLENMDYLREGVHLRSMAQKDPLVEYTAEGERMFTDLGRAIRGEVVLHIFHAELAPDEAQQLVQEPSQTANGNVRYEHETATGAQAIAQAGAGEAVMAGVPSAAGVLQQAVQASPHEKLGRNDPCWCGSGKKFKKCHGA
jgi:preprotein translocase subunit SecA